MQFINYDHIDEYPVFPLLLCLCKFVIVGSSLHYKFPVQLLINAQRNFGNPLGAEGSNSLPVVFSVSLSLSLALLLLLLLRLV